MLIALSFILAIGGCVSLYMVSHHKARSGWWLNMALQAVWLPYDMITHQWGFLIISASTIVVARASLVKIHQAAVRAIPVLDIRHPIIQAEGLVTA